MKITSIRYTYPNKYPVGSLGHKDRSARQGHYAEDLDFLQGLPIGAVIDLEYEGRVLQITIETK